VRPVLCKKGQDDVHGRHMRIWNHFREC
jgi:hypothetical protein